MRRFTSQKQKRDESDLKQQGKTEFIIKCLVNFKARKIYKLLDKETALQIQQCLIANQKDSAIHRQSCKLVKQNDNSDDESHATISNASSDHLKDLNDSVVDQIISDDQVQQVPKHNFKLYDKFKVKFDRFNQELTKSQLELDVGIMQGLLSQSLIQEIKSSYGINSLYYTVTQGTDLFQSEKVSDSFRTPQWQETFTFTLEHENEKLLFEIFRHNSSEGDLQIDQFELIIQEYIEKLKDQSSKSMLITSDNENGFKVMMKWRYEDSGIKLQILKKKIQQLKEIVQKDSRELKQFKESYENLFNFEGDCRQLIQIWGLNIILKQSPDSKMDNAFHTLESNSASPDLAYEVRPNKISKQAKKRPLAKVSRHNSRSSSQMDEQLTQNSRQDTLETITHPYGLQNLHQKNNSLGLNNQNSNLLNKNTKFQLFRPPFNNTPEPNIQNNNLITKLNGDRGDSKDNNKDNLRMESPNSNYYRGGGYGQQFENQTQLRNQQIQNLNQSILSNRSGSNSPEKKFSRNQLQAKKNIPTMNTSPDLNKGMPPKLDLQNQSMNGEQSQISDRLRPTDKIFNNEAFSLYKDLKNKYSSNQQNGKTPINSAQQQLNNQQNQQPPLPLQQYNSQSNIANNKIAQTIIKVPDITNNNMNTTTNENEHDSSALNMTFTELLKQQDELDKSRSSQHSPEQFNFLRFDSNNNNEIQNQDDQGIHRFTFNHKTERQEQEHDSNSIPKIDIPNYVLGLPQTQTHNESQFIQTVEEQEFRAANEEEHEIFAEGEANDKSLPNRTDANQGQQMLKRKQMKGKQMHEMDMDMLEGNTSSDQVKPQIVEVGDNIVGFVEFVETRQEALKQRELQAQLIKQMIEQRAQQPFKSVFTSQKAQKTVAQDDQDLQTSEQSALSPFNTRKAKDQSHTMNMQQQDLPQKSKNQEVIDDLQRQIEEIMKENELHSSPDSINQRDEDDILMKSNGGPSNMKRNQKGMNKQQHQFIDNKSNSPDDLKSLGSQPIRRDQSIGDFSQNSKEILEPTMKNLRRMELRNQRRDIQTSLVTCSIDNLIDKHARKSVIVENKPSISEYSGSQNQFQIPRVTPQFKGHGSSFKFGQSMNGSMYRFGGMGIGHLMKSLEAGSIMAQHALIKNIDQQNEANITSNNNEDTFSQNSSIFSPVQNVAISDQNNHSQSMKIPHRGSHLINNSIFNHQPSGPEALGKRLSEYSNPFSPPKLNSNSPQLQQQQQPQMKQQENTQSSGFGFFFQRAFSRPSSIFGGK
ncbi:UNKNOWN [Stylonychia lemnae]|uniref:C2 domain-containing protein n=1 Tax=Stylonychia lemnae TaxID=5949 RepID=A0A078AHS3_STYLE|nr:UNKNOWN [Stylonychia lemnae]|eukprot:CDW81047.1 UNKNOWN [Stylonychia lemnae]